MYKKKGFTLIEVLIVLFILGIVAAVSMDFFISSRKVYSKISDGVDKQANVRIAMEFITRHIRNAKSISLSKDSGGKDVLTIDGDKLYLRYDNILRFKVDSQQIASNITAFNAVDMGSGVYKITVTSDDYSQTTLISQRE
jgi:prepilin-type N-terminal cleavage/methylation domain-containing protein